MRSPAHRLTDAEGALLDEIAILARREGPEVPIKDLELRLEERGFSDAQTRRALMSLLRRGQVSLSGAKRVASRSRGRCGRTATPKAASLYSGWRRTKSTTKLQAGTILKPRRRASSSAPRTSSEPMPCPSSSLGTSVWVKTSRSPCW